MYSLSSLKPVPRVYQRDRPGTLEHTQSVYERIRSRLLEAPLAPGHLLQIGLLAEDLGVSSTPVREALMRLTAERLIACTPRRGFFAITPSQEDMRGLYCVTHTMLAASLESPYRELSASGQAQVQKLAAGLRALESASQAVLLTEELFVRLATDSGIGEAVQIVRNANDRLRHVRSVEHIVVGDVRPVLLEMCAAYKAENHERLRTLLRAYHDERLSAVRSICKELLCVSFLGNRKSGGGGGRR